MRKLWKERFGPLIQDDLRRLVLLGLLVAMLVVGLVWGRGTTISGLNQIITHPSRLLSDYVALAGPGPALVNAALVGLIGLLLLTVLHVDITGPTMAAIMTMVGFGLFGKNIFNIFPIFFGVWLYAKVEGGGLRRHILPALFGTALGPVVSQTAFGSGLGLPAGIIIGIVAGFILSPLAAHLLRNHQGFNLYNLGFTAGFVGLFVVSFLRGLGSEVPAKLLWDTEGTTTYSFLVLGLCLSLIILGLIFNRGRFSGYREILAHPGTLVTDFISLAGFGPALINMGLVGLVGLGYLLLIGGDVNGPTAGGVLTMIGFGAFGKHPRNIVPLMFGVWLASWVFHFPVDSPGAQLAGLFATTMAPLTLQFGNLTAVAAGFLHMIVVHNVGAVHGGLNLYNNGFSGGLIATAIVAIYRGLRRDD
ncbi:MAG: DUF1576 domain-containing protein [Firmicutes bacterium]|nr:DUF1576 domain-containing protein [Bacillota bacterium]